MWKLGLTLFALLAMTVAGLPGQDNVIHTPARTRADEEHAQWIGGVMQAIAAIQPGMTRQDVFQVFTEEGGLSTRTRKTYVYKHCPYIKVDVEFSAIEDSGVDAGSPVENPADKIVKISRPYLEPAHVD
jgi:hypothetical protein